MSISGKAAKELGLGMFTHIGFVIRKMDDVLEYYEDTLHLGHFDSADLIAESDNGKAKLKASVAQFSGIQFELIQPLDEDRIHTPFLKQGREGLHHLGFFVKEFDKKIKELEGNGIKVLERGRMLTADGKPLGIHYAYLNTAHTSGVVYELVKF